MTVLIGGPKKEVTRQKGWRLRDTLVEYVEKRSGGNSRGERQVVEEALSVHRAINDLLPSEEKRLHRFAVKEGLELPRDADRIIARLVLLGLEASEKKER